MFNVHQLLHDMQLISITNVCETRFTHFVVKRYVPQIHGPCADTMVDKLQLPHEFVEHAMNVCFFEMLELWQNKILVINCTRCNGKIEAGNDG